MTSDRSGARTTIPRVVPKVVPRIVSRVVADVGVVAGIVVGALVLVGCSPTAGGDGGAGAGGTEGAGGVAGCPAPSSTVGFDRSTGLGALPVASFTGLEDPDEQVCTTDWEGTPTVVNFWAEWCGPCRAEMPALEAAHERLGERVEFVGINVQDVREEALGLLEESGTTYRSVVDPQQEDGYYGRLGNRGMPTTLFVDADGTIVHRHTGPLSEDQTLELVAEHLGVDV